MERYDYREAIKNDVRNYINDNIDFKDFNDVEGLREKLYDDLWLDDSVTGNGSGSYTFNNYEAEENIAHNLDLLGESLEEFGYDADFLITHGAEACDVTIRCYLLGECVDEVLEECVDEVLEEEKNEFINVKEQNNNQIKDMKEDNQFIEKKDIKESPNKEKDVKNRGRKNTDEKEHINKKKNKIRR